MKYLLIIFLFISCKQTPLVKNEVQFTPSYVPKVFNATTLDLPYRILTPQVIIEDTPIILFLHGAGERGYDNELQLKHGSQLFLDSIAKYPAILVFPQCPLDGYWSNVAVDRSGYPLRLEFESEPTPTPSMQATMELMEMLIKKYKLKSHHIVLGLSMGGMGTFELLQYQPDLFNKAIAICGGGHPDWVNRYSSDLSIWIAHGEADNVVSISESELMHKAIHAHNINVKFDKYPDVYHNSWDNLFADPKMMSWLFTE